MLGSDDEDFVNYGSGFGSNIFNPNKNRVSVMRAAYIL
mgnify:CR=1 FL=1